VPLVSDLSLGFCPGISGARPVFHIVDSAAVAGGVDDMTAAGIESVSSLRTSLLFGVIAFREHDVVVRCERLLL